MKFISLLLLFLILVISTFGQKKLTMSGYISDKQTSEKLPGASIKLEKQNKGVSANNYGFYSLTLSPGDYTIAFSFVGYEIELVSIQLSNDTIIDISLKSSLTIKEVTVKARRTNNSFTESTETGTDIVTIETIKKMPALAGEPDVLKTLAVLTRN